MTLSIISTCSDGTMPFEQANVNASFYYDYQETNVLIDEAERMTTEDAERLSGACSFSQRTNRCIPNNALIRLKK